MSPECIRWVRSPLRMTTTKKQEVGTIMKAQPVPGVFHLDVNGANGTPFRFVYDLTEPSTLRYYDRRYPLAEGEPGYGVNHMNEDGQACGPALSINHINWLHANGFRGWHDVAAWGVDRATVVMVGNWIEMIKERQS